MRLAVDERNTRSLFARSSRAVHASGDPSIDNVFRMLVPAFPPQHRRLMEGATVNFGGHDWRVIIGYGHAPEHASLYCEQLNVLISGDMLLPKISTNVSVWASDPVGDPLRLFLESINRYTTLPDDTLVLPSHGLPFIGIRARVKALVDHHRDRLAELEAAAVGKVSAFDVLPVLFRRKLDLQQQFFAMGEAIAHLNHSWHRGRMRRELGSSLPRY